MTTPAPSRRQPLAVGAQIRRRRRARWTTLSELASACEIDISALSKIERGLRDPSLRQMERIASALGTSLLALLR